MMKRIILITGFLINVLGMYAQSTEKSLFDLKSMLVNINNAYLKKGPMKSEVSYFISEGDVNTNIKTLRSATYVTNDTRNYMKQENLEVIRTGMFNVMVDHERKLVVVEKNLIKTVNKIPYGMLDSMLVWCSKAYMLPANGLETWSMEFKNLSTKRMELTIDPKIMEIKSMVTYLEPDATSSKGQVIRMVITSSPIDKKVSEELLDEKKIVSIDKKGKVKLQEKYKSYRLLTPEVNL